jgi:hypothetical protein
MLLSCPKLKGRVNADTDRVPLPNTVDPFVTGTGPPDFTFAFQNVPKFFHGPVTDGRGNSAGRKQAVRQPAVISVYQQTDLGLVRCEVIVRPGQRAYDIASQSGNVYVPSL